MQNWLRALIAGYGAKKLGGGCFSMILIFIVIYFALGQCNHPVRHGSIAPQPTMQSASGSSMTVSYLAVTNSSSGK